MQALAVTLIARWILSIRCSLRILFDATYAGRVAALDAARTNEPALDAARTNEPALDAARTNEPALDAARTRAASSLAPVERDLSPALQLLALLQREGRLVDFSEQDIASFGDAEVGAAARVVHAGCRKALRAAVELERVRGEAEGARLTLASAARDVSFTGEVRGAGPYSGTLRHVGWRVTALRLPELAPGADASLIAPAEIEL